MMMRRTQSLLLAVTLCLLPGLALAGGSDHEGPGRGRDGWVAAWSTSPQGPYPISFMVAQPLLSPVPYPAGFTTDDPQFAFPGDQANEQSFRLIVQPSIGGTVWRLRFSNTFGTRPVTLGRVQVGLQETGANVVPGTQRSVTFGDQESVTIPVGEEIYTDPVRLALAGEGEGARRGLAVSFYVKGESGPMTFHAAAFMTSYVTEPGAGDHTGDVAEFAFIHSTSSWFFLDGLEVRAPRGTQAIVAFGDSITDGFFSTMNETDRWPDLLQRRLRQRYGDKISVVNEGIGGNAVTSIPRTPPGCTECGGIPAGERLERDVFGQAGVRWVIWLEGINDLGAAPATADDVIAGMKEVIQRVHERGLCIIGATLTPSTGTVFGEYGTEATNAQRERVNEFIRTSDLWDGVADFDAAVRDPARPGYLRPAYNTNSTTGGMSFNNVTPAVQGGIGDFLHPNRAGFIAMAKAIDLDLFRKACKWAHAGHDVGDVEEER